MPADYRPTRKVVALSMTSAFDVSMGWSMSVAVAHEDGDRVISDHARYEGLTANELLDVLAWYTDLLS